ncbi:PREDICTED: uncharacterized protein LOC108557327 [Nicrophorus vespilloides]|uniref:Uncharacterized protein LOC108557327 n=1 Tax=Nicrophorus vespilloides TaxID=110193 RepID=A0ABM1M3Z0_NICVS|nr:PREDICTED: uncharacterized protein LOC108557327 [Nicrophorus vespilloides]
MDEKSVETEEPKRGFFSVNKKLIMLKLTLFFLYGANSSLMPYLTIHMQSIGLTVRQISIIYLTLPLTTFLTPPITGFLVDKFGQYKPVVIISFLMTALVHHALFIIPHQEIPGTEPEAYVMRHSRDHVEVWWSPCPSRECTDEEEINVVLGECFDHCLLKPRNQTTANASMHLANQDGFRKEGPGVLFVLDMHPDLGDPVEVLGIELESKEDDTAIEFKVRFTEKLLTQAGVNFTELDNSDLRCGGIVLRHNNTGDWAGDCIVQKCKFHQGGPEICPPDFKETDNKTYWIYFVLRFVGSIMMTAGVTIMDPIALTMIEKYGGDFGREKLFSSMGMALFSPITGVLIDYSSKYLGYTNYSPAFFTYDVLMVISAIAVYLMPLGSKLPADNIFKDMINIFKMPNVIIFIIFMFLLGNPWGFIENYLFLYLKDLGAPNALLGVTVTVGTLSSMPFLYGAEKITKKIGHVNIIIIAFFAHSARLMGYSFIESAWWCFPFEAMESLSVHLMWVAAATYCAVIAPKGLLATLIGVIGMAHFSIGRGSGSFIGGRLIGEYGIREAFRLMGTASVVFGVAYAVLHMCWLRKIEIIYQEEDMIDEVKPEPEPKTRDQGTMVSFERLSLIIEYNQVGSLTSLGRFVNKMDGEVLKRARRGSDSFGMFKRSRGSASKVDLLKSATEVNHSRNSFKTSAGQLSRQNGSSTKMMIDGRTSSAPRLASQKSSSLSPIQAKELEKLIPDEAEELIYDNEK